MHLPASPSNETTEAARRSSASTCTRQEVIDNSFKLKLYDAGTEDHVEHTETDGAQQDEAQGMTFTLQEGWMAGSS